jgi:hypothetical protein
MKRVRRRSRAVYRVYGEKEYLAGADALATQEDPSLAAEPVCGRGLRRVACATALTGTVGAVGGVVGLAGLRTHVRALDRRVIAQRIVAPSVRMAAPGGHPSASRRVARGQSPRRDLSRRVHERRPLVMRASLGTASRAQAPVRTFARSSAATQAPPEAEARPAAQSEFGFER